MTLTHPIALAFVLASASTLIACSTAPAMPMNAAPAGAMGSPERMGSMDAQMKTMKDMHARMMNARTPDERQALMAEHMKAMQGGMAAMKGMPGMSGMGAMGDGKAMPAEMAQHHGMMAQHMEMMQMMMAMMSQRMAPMAGQQ